MQLHSDQKCIYKDAAATVGKVKKVQKNFVIYEIPWWRPGCQVARLPGCQVARLPLSTIETLFFSFSTSKRKVWSFTRKILQHSRSWQLVWSLLGSSSFEVVFIYRSALLPMGVIFCYCLSSNAVCFCCRLGSAMDVWMVTPGWL